MKKTKILIPLALTMLLAGCGVDDSSAPSSPSDPGSDTSTTPSGDSSSSTPGGDTTSSTPGGDSSSSGGDDSSSSIPTPVDVSIDSLVSLAEDYKTGKANIKSGEIKHYYSGEYSSGIDESTKKYEYGTDKYGETAKLTDVDDEWGDTVTYLMYDAKGTLLTITENDEGQYEKDSYNSYNDIGTKFENYIEYGTTAYGVEGLFKSVMQYGKKNKNKDFEAYMLNQRIYFSYGWHDGDDYNDPWDYYAVKGDFPVCDGYLDSFNVTFSYYSSSDWDYANGVCTLHDDAKANDVNEWSFAQVAGDRDYVNPVNLDSFDYQDFSLVDGEGHTMSATQGISMNKDGNVELNIQTTTSTANLNFDTPTITAITGGEEGDITINPYRSGDGTMEVINVYGNKVGTFTITISTKNCSVTFPVTVNEIKPTYMALRHYTDSPSGDYSTQKVANGDSVSTYVGVLHYFTAYTLPRNANSAIAATVTDNDGDPVDEADYTIDTDTLYPGDDERETTALTIQFDTTGEYILRIYCEADNSIAAEINFSVGNAYIQNVLSAGSYNVRNRGIYGNYYNFTFTPSDELSGSVTIKDYDTGDTINTTYTISKVDDEDYYEFEFNDTVPFDTLYVGADYKLYCEFNSSYVECFLQDSLEAKMPRVWSGTATDDDDYTYDLSLQLRTNGMASGTITYDDCDYYLDCEYTIKKNAGEGAGWTITFVDDGFVDESYMEWFNYSGEKTATLSEDLTTLSVNCTYFDITVDMTAA